MESFQRLPVTFSLISACAVIFLGAVLTAGGGAIAVQPEALILNGGLIPESVAAGELWRLVTSMFLHASLIHIAVNMVALFFLGSFAEQAFGRERFFFLYLVSGLSGGIAYLYFGTFTTPAVGASGAIFGLLGGILGFSLRRGTFSWQNPVIRQLLIITAINLFIGASIPQVSNTAHIGGLIGGLLFGAMIATSVHSRKRSSLLTPFALVLGVELILIAAWMIFV